MYMYLYSLYTTNYTVHMYIYIYIHTVYIYTYIYTVYIYIHLCFFMFSLGLKRILQETSHLQWENHGKCSCVSADFPEIS